MIKQLELLDINQVVFIHHQELSGFLSKIGQGFLKKFYEVSLNSSDMFTFVYKENGKILGFAGGVMTSRGLNHRIIVKDPLGFGMVLLKHLILHPTHILKLFQTLSYPGFDKDMPELLSIAVSQKHQGKGIGKKLFLEVAGEFNKRKKKEFLVSVYDRLPANKFYIKMGCRQHKSFEFLGERMNYYIYRISKLI